MITSSYRLRALPRVGFVNKLSSVKCRRKKQRAMRRSPARRNYPGVSSSQSQKGDKRAEPGNLSPQEPPRLFVVLFGKFWKTGVSEKRVCQWALSDDGPPARCGSRERAAAAR